MKILLAALLLATSVAQAQTKAPTPPKWKFYGLAKAFSISVDLESLGVEHKNGGWEVTTNIKLDFFQEFDVKGKKKKGSYYVNTITAVCKDNSFRVDNATAYSADDEPLGATKKPTIINNPGTTGNFITDFVATSCNKAKEYKPHMTA